MSPLLSSQAKYEIKKGTRHSKITGNFCESLVLYWLSKHGFECANIDHTGIDLIAYNSYTNERIGISVKGRSKTENAYGTGVSISNDNFDKIKVACDAFNLVPYVAIVVDDKDKITAFILSIDHLLEIFPKGKSVCEWKMSEKHIVSYRNDNQIKIFEFEYKTLSWWD